VSQDQEQGLRILDNALWRIARRGDCEYNDTREEERPRPCDCPRCLAIAALGAAKSWRFHGAFHARTQSGNWPRETKMQAAWVKLVSDRDPDTVLSRILQEERVPTARDWYVATSVIQWLATNVGMTVLEAAGFKYQQWEQDHADGPLFQRRQEQEVNDAKRRANPATDPTTAAIAAQGAERDQLRADVTRLERELVAARAAVEVVKAAQDRLAAEGYDKAVREVREHFVKQQQPSVVGEIDKVWGSP